MGFLSRQRPKALTNWSSGLRSCHTGVGRIMVLQEAPQVSFVGALFHGVV